MAFKPVDVYDLLMIRRLVLRLHAAKRMIQRRIAIEDIAYVVDKGAIIEEYPDDTPYPSCLLLGWIDGHPLHAVIADEKESDFTHVITAYFPDPERWDEEFKRRKL